ncbi:hypothetical protein BS47DRAFT_1363562 [Hydnum rufescens UP504]|uniref:Ubiquitin-like protease family profile domain-containing protein n=1 Tax=Hydnum rufescens UP504 TaxID=1448309 RepID=A0A9P6DVL3_9AGAM|nr:hypothetical protein BS47DRAFT_1363562 [Hydnum rufescens UP504]
MSLSSASHVYDPPAEDAVVPSGALHHPCEGQELGSGSGTPSMVQYTPAEDAMMHSGVLCHPRKDPELVGSTLLTLLFTWELSEASVEYLTEPFTWSSSGQLSNTVYHPLEEYPDLCTLTVASGEISADVNPITNRFYLKKHYVDALAAFVGSVSTTAQRWYSHIQRNGFHVPVPLPLCEYPGANFQRHFKHHNTKVRIMADVEIFLQHGYLCRGIWRTPMSLESSEDWNEMGYLCLQRPFWNHGPEHDFLLISVEYAVPFDHPFPWFSAPAYGYPGFYYQYRDEKYYEEQAFLEALVVVDPQQESIPLLTKSYKVVEKFLGPGPFFCARNPPISVFPLMNPDVPGALESARINPPLDPLLTTLALAPPQMVQSMARRKYGQRPRPPHLPSKGGFIMFRDGTLVNDDAINSYIDVLKMFVCPTVHVFNTFFFSCLLDGFNKVATWHKDLCHPVFTHMEQIIVPIHLKSQSHWATISIDFKRHIVTYMDSIFLPSTFEFVMEIMRKYLADLAALEMCSFDLEAWTFIGSKDTSPQQTGTVDCGVFLIANIRNCAGIQPWKVLHPTEVPSARLQFMVDVVWGVIDYPWGYDHALQSIFLLHSPPAFILPDEPDYIHVPHPALPCPVPKIMPTPMPAVTTVTPSGRNEQPSPQQCSWGDITENEGHDLIWNAWLRRIMVVLDHHVRVKNKDATPLAWYLRAHWRGKARGVYDWDFDWQEHSHMWTISHSQPGDDHLLHCGSLRDAGLLPSDQIIFTSRWEASQWMLKSNPQSEE